MRLGDSQCARVAHFNPQSCAMDPFTALVLASDILRFADFAGKLVSVTRKNHVSLSGAKEEHLELESLVRNIRELVERAKLHGISKNGTLSSQDDMLLELSNQCINVSDKLLSVLESLKVKGDNQAWDSFYEALRSQLKNDKIKVLQQRLDRSVIS
jgi:hypothetical protein